MFPSRSELKEGKEQFEEGTATISLEPYKEYDIHTILIFYIEGNELTEQKIQDIIKRFP